MLNRTIKRNYPFLANSALSLKELNRRHPLVQTKIRQVFFHKIAGFVLQQTSPLIIYGFASMTLVALYGNYTLIMMGIYSLVNALSNGLTAGIGNLVAEGDKKRIMPVFEELFSVRFLIACTISFGMLTLAQPFITLWIGEEFLLPNSTLCIMTGILFFNISRTAVDSFINAHGFYSDIYAPIIEALLNIGCSIGLGFFWGLNGILVGVLISLVIIPACWKPIFLFKINLKYGFGEYVKSYTIHLVMALGAAVISFYLLYILPIEPSSDVWQFLLYGLISVMLFSALLGLALWMTGCGLRHFLKRCESIINKV